MDKEKNNNIEDIVSYFHERNDSENTIDSNLRSTPAFRESEKIYNLRHYVSFLYRMSESENWNKINSRINRGRVFPMWMKYVAIIILSFSAGSMAFYFSYPGKGSTTVGSITSPKGQITTTTLFDGTLVWLNSESTIRYNSDFNTKNRDVFVEGEAYFEVSHNKKLPFIVNLEKSKVLVHGTCFNVNSFKGSENVYVTLKEGKIEFLTKDSSTILNPNEKIVFNLENKTATKSAADVEKIIGWKEGKYYYTKENLAALILQLQRWYGVQIVIKDEKLLNYKFTGVMNRDESIIYNLQTIEMTNKIKVVVNGDEIIITGR